MDTKNEILDIQNQIFTFQDNIEILKNKIKLLQKECNHEMTFSHNEFDPCTTTRVFRCIKYFSKKYT